MTRDPRHVVAMRAVAAGLAAQTGDLDALEVAGLQAQSDELLPDRADPLFRAVSEFATRHELIRRQPEQLAEAGAALVRAVELALVPAPVDLHRVDIHG